MNIKPLQCYVSKNGSYVERVGSGYVVFTESGHFIGETLGQFDAFKLADRGETMVKNKPLHVIWNFADDEPVYIYGKQSWFKEDLAEDALSEFITSELDCQSHKKFMKDWYGVINIEQVEDKLIKYMGA